MTTPILITTVSIIGLIFSLRSRGIFQKVITVGLCISIFNVWTSDSYILAVSILLQLGLAIISTIYGFTVKKLSILERITIATTGIILTLGSLTIMQHWPGQDELRFALIVPIALFLWISIKHGRKQPKEFGFMLIWITIATVEMIKFLIQ